LEKGRHLQDSHPVEVDPQEDLEVETFQEDPQLGEDPLDHQAVEEGVHQVVELLEEEAVTANLEATRQIHLMGTEPCSTNS
jgi:hypothetical protein